MSKTENDEPDLMFVGESFVPFGNRYLHMPNLMKGYLSLRTARKSPVRSRPAVMISNEMKNMLLEIVFKKKFDKNRYAKLSTDEQKLFDDTCGFCGIFTHGLSAMLSHSATEKQEMLLRFDVMKGELLAGNDSRELVKQMRNLLLELYAKRYIPKPHYDKLLHELVSCL